MSGGHSYRSAGCSARGGIREAGRPGPGRLAGRLRHRCRGPGLQFTAEVVRDLVPAGIPGRSAPWASRGGMPCWQRRQQQTLVGPLGQGTQASSALLDVGGRPEQQGVMSHVRLTRVRRQNPAGAGSVSGQAAGRMSPGAWVAISSSEAVAAWRSEKDQGRIRPRKQQEGAALSHRSRSGKTAVLPVTWHDTPRPLMHCHPWLTRRSRCRKNVARMVRTRAGGIHVGPMMAVGITAAKAACSTARGGPG